MDQAVELATSQEYFYNATCNELAYQLVVHKMPVPSSVVAAAGHAPPPRAFPRSIVLSPSRKGLGAAYSNATAAREPDDVVAADDSGKVTPFAQASAVDDDAMRFLAAPTSGLRKTLRALSVADSRVSDDGVAALCTATAEGNGEEPLCTSLEELDLSGCTRVTDAAIAQLTLFRQLVVLDISRCGAGAVTKRFLAAPTSGLRKTLRALSVADSRVSDDGVAALCTATAEGNGEEPLCTSLEELDLSGCTRVTDAAIAQLTLFRQLVVLDISRCGAGAVTKRFLAAPTSGLRKTLRALSVADSRVSDDGVAALCTATAEGNGEEPLCTSLEELDLSGCTRVTDAAIAQLTLFRQLVVLDISRCGAGAVTKRFLAAPTSGLRKTLRALSVADSRVSDDGVAALCTATAEGNGEEPLCTSLEELDLSGCTRVTDAAIAQLTLFRQLVVLDISRCGAGAVSVANTLRQHDALPKLQVFRAAGAVATDRVLAALACHGRQLREISLVDGGDALSDAGIAHFAVTAAESLARAEFVSCNAWPKLPRVPRAHRERAQLTARAWWAWRRSKSSLASTSGDAGDTSRGDEAELDFESRGGGGGISFFDRFVGGGGGGGGGGSARLLFFPPSLGGGGPAGGGGRT
ncbi:hypothetical protein PPROV_000051600 [Pycnococcus provasolii]|uniref:Uncharacterized protein n=1 Tax=Pycnococcus provasolii TaxID=41880 RepID=A0A830H896_9CHLO|nr:hypothetical protein PPROV_000051600 [Pycnococcus provasolii]